MDFDGQQDGDMESNPWRTPGATSRTPRFHKKRASFDNVIDFQTPSTTSSASPSSQAQPSSPLAAQQSSPLAAQQSSPLAAQQSSPLAAQQPSPRATQPSSPLAAASLKREPSSERDEQPLQKKRHLGPGSTAAPSQVDDAAFIRGVATQLQAFDAGAAKRLRRLLMFRTNPDVFPFEVRRIVNTHVDRLEKLLSVAKDCNAGVHKLGDASLEEKGRTAQTEQDILRRQQTIQQRLGAMKFG